MNKFTRQALVVGVGVAVVAGRLLRPRKRRSVHDRSCGLLFVGTYTKKTSKGIYAYRWMPLTGEMAEIGLAAETKDPSFLALSPSRKDLYAVNEVSGRHGTVTGFLVAPLSGKLRPKNTVASGGSAPCHLAMDRTDQALFVANYYSGSMTSYKILQDGMLSEPVTEIYFPGGSVHPERQRTAHTHGMVVTPENKYLLVSDLGLDRIMVYELDAKTAKLRPNDPPFYRALPGSGPRSLTFHPNGRWVYSINELSNSLDCLNWDSSKGVLTRFQNVSTLPMDHETPTSAATVQVHPGGNFLYASNRGDDSITVFSVHPVHGRLTLIQRISCEGNVPRHFAVDPSGKWVVVANQESDNLVVLRCNVHTGKLSSSGRQYPIDSPVCVVFD